MATKTHDTPIRLGVFHSVGQANQAIAGLVKAGFAKNQITVMCSDQEKEAQFRDCKHAQPAGAGSVAAIVKGVAISAAVAAIGCVWGAVSAGDWVTLAAASVVVPGAGVFGAMVGAMLVEGSSGELAEFYEQAVEDGEILIAAEDHSNRRHELLGEAERVFSAAGAKPIELSGG